MISDSPKLMTITQMKSTRLAFSFSGSRRTIINAPTVVAAAERMDGKAFRSLKWA